MSETFTGHRLDRWLKRTDPYKGLNLSQAHIEKLLRQKKILVNGQKATASTRITEQDQVTLAKGLSLDFLRIPERPIPKTKAFVYSQEDIQFLSTLILWEDEEICVLNKPSGLAVQGGTGTTKHLDGLLQAYGRGQPFRLVHRLDKDTSGVLVVAKTLEKSIELAKAFQKGNIEKTYWALTGERSLDPTVGETFENLLDPKGSIPLRTGWKKTPEMLFPTSEEQMVEWVFKQSCSNRISLELVKMVHAPKEEGRKRATTKTTVEAWLKENPKGGNYLAVSTQPFGLYQLLVLRHHVLAKGRVDILIDVIAAKFPFSTYTHQSEEKLRQFVNIALDNIAKICYELVEIEKLRA